MGPSSFARQANGGRGELSYTGAYFQDRSYPITLLVFETEKKDEVRNALSLSNCAEGDSPAHFKSLQGEVDREVRNFELRSIQFGEVKD